MIENSHPNSTCFHKFASSKNLNFNNLALLSVFNIGVKGKFVAMMIDYMPDNLAWQ